MLCIGKLDPGTRDSPAHVACFGSGVGRVCVDVEREICQSLTVTEMKCHLWSCWFTIMKKYFGPPMESYFGQNTEAQTTLAPVFPSQPYIQITQVPQNVKENCLHFSILADYPVH